MAGAHALVWPTRDVEPTTALIRPIRAQIARAPHTGSTPHTTAKKAGPRHRATTRRWFK